jgi:hypothetical protein
VYRQGSSLRGLKVMSQEVVSIERTVEKKKRVMENWKA